MEEQLIMQKITIMPSGNLVSLFPKKIEFELGLFHLFCHLRKFTDSISNEVL